jgi:hypothetical protein
MKDMTVKDTITIPREWLPTIVKVLGYVTDGYGVEEYNDEEQALVDAVLMILRGIEMRTKDVPLVAMPRVPMIGDE